MAHYRKIDTRIVLDQKFNALSSDARLVFFHVLVHINLTSLGAMRASVPGLADELNWEVDQFERALLELCQQGMVHYDKAARFLWLPNFLKYNLPESPNVIKSWETALSYLPECPLRDALILHVNQFVAGLSLPFQEALPDCFQKIVSSFQNGVEEIKTASESEREFSKTPSGSPLETIKTPSESHPDTLSEGANENQNPLRESLNIKHKALSIKHKALNIKQEEKEEIGEITNIVAPARPKTMKHSSPEIVQVFEHWKVTLQHPQAVLDDKRQKVIRHALASGYSVAQLCQAINGCAQTPHNLGDNDRGQRYDGLQVILRDADQIDRFIRNAHSPPRPQNKADKLINDSLATGQSWMHKKIREQGEKTVNECT